MHDCFVVALVTTIHLRDPVHHHTTSFIVIETIIIHWNIRILSYLARDQMLDIAFIVNLTIPAWCCSQIRWWLSCLESMSGLRFKICYWKMQSKIIEPMLSMINSILYLTHISINYNFLFSVVSNGLNGAASLDSLPGPSSPSGPESLPPLPGLPGMSTTSLPTALPTLPLLSNPMMVPPMFGAGGILPMEMRQPPLGGRMSPGPRDSRSYGSRSPSPEYDRGYRGGGSGRYRDRDASPTSRSERRISPTRHCGASPARSERQYYSGGRGVRDDRDERLNVRSGGEYRFELIFFWQHWSICLTPGPKTSTPGDPPRGYTRA